MYKYLLLFFLLTGFALQAIAQRPQVDSVKKNKEKQSYLHRDSVTSKRFVPKVTQEKAYHPDSNHSPHIAVMRSLMVPGWGQLYNHQWWKVPVIYTGLGLLADAIIFNQRGYAPNLVVAHYYERGETLQTLPTTAKDYSLFKQYQQIQVQAQTVYDIVDSYRRDRDLSIMGFLGAWGVQMVDAYIDAKFQHSYTMDTDFSFKISPTILNQQSMYAENFNGPVIPGLKLTFALR
jgi:hypothetical protein